MFMILKIELLGNQHRKTTLFQILGQIIFLTKEHISSSQSGILYTIQEFMETPLSSFCLSDSWIKTMLEVRVADLCPGILSCPHHISLDKMKKSMCIHHTLLFLSFILNPCKPKKVRKCYWRSALASNRVQCCLFRVLVINENLMTASVRV